MENKEISYSFEDTYLRILPEGRIRRRQYIGRLFGFGILLGILGYGIESALGSNIGVIFAVNILLAGVGLYGYFVLNMKRVRDIGQGVKSVFYITLAVIVMTLLVKIYNFCGEMGWIPHYINVFMQALDKMSTLFGGTSALEYSWHQNIIKKIELFSGVVAVAQFVVLFLMKWKTGDNEFGNDPMKTKLGFFG